MKLTHVLWENEPGADLVFNLRPLNTLDSGFSERGGWAVLNRLRAVDKWIFALVMPPPSLALAGIGLIGRLPAKRGMRAAPGGERQRAVQPATRLRDATGGAQGDFLVCDRPPEPFDKDMVAPRALAIHADRNLGVLQGREKGDGGELAALIRVQNLRPTMPSQGFAQRLQARLRLQRNREPPRKHLAAEPVDDRHQIHEPTRHGHIGDVHCPDLVRLGDGQLP